MPGHVVVENGDNTNAEMAALLSDLGALKQSAGELLERQDDVERTFRQVLEREATHSGALDRLEGRVDAVTETQANLARRIEEELITPEEAKAAERLRDEAIAVREKADAYIEATTRMIEILEYIASYGSPKAWGRWLYEFFTLFLRALLLLALDKAITMAYMDKSFSLIETLGIERADLERDIDKFVWALTVILLIRRVSGLMRWAFWNVLPSSVSDRLSSCCCFVVGS